MAAEVSKQRSAGAHRDDAGWEAQLAKLEAHKRKHGDCIVPRGRRHHEFEDRNAENGTHSRVGKKDPDADEALRRVWAAVADCKVG